MYTAIGNAFNGRVCVSSTASTAADLGAVMQAVASGTQCHLCKRFGHYRRDSPRKGYTKRSNERHGSLHEDEVAKGGACGARTIGLLRQVTPSASTE